jgi:LCP family protein required for cell wall assembly
MKRHRKRRDGPELHLEEDQLHLYSKRALKRRQIRGHIEGPEEPHIHLDGEQPQIFRRRRIHWRSVLKWCSIALIVVLVVLFVLGYIWLKSKESQMRVAGVEEVLDPKREGQPVTTLVMGIDRGSVPGEAASRSDIMMLVSYNPVNNKSAVISIPRDSRVQIPGQKGRDKINAAHAFGGPKLAIETVKDFTGLDINHYVEIDFQGFKHIVNALGGVKMQVDVAINDKYAGKVPAGDVVLTGDQALALVRARHDVNAVPAGDLDRIKNQRKFLQAMLSTISHTRNPFRVITVVDAASENIKTDLSFTEMLSLGRRLQGAGGNLTMTTVPGQPKLMGGAWYYIVDEAQFQSMLASFKTQQVVDSSTEQQVPAVQSDKTSIKIGVLNGAGVSGLAGSVAAQLAQAGYTGVTTGNAESKYSKTTIYYADQDSSRAGTVAADLAGVQEPLIQSNDEMATSHGVDVLVVLGSDYRKP